jgi:hypothetical protein
MPLPIVRASHNLNGVTMAGRTVGSAKTFEYLAVPAISRSDPASGEREKCPPVITGIALEQGGSGVPARNGMCPALESRKCPVCRPSMGMMRHKYR